MGIEIELKARVHDTEACRRRLEAIAGPGAAFVKNDEYWFLKAADGGAERSAAAKAGGGTSPADFFSSGLRIRREEKAGKKQILVTWKTKEKRGKIEVNEEKEFALTGQAVFEELLAALGFEKRIVKNKNGFVWRILDASGRGGLSGAAGPLTAELCEVSGLAGKTEKAKSLGWFLELEIIAESGGALPPHTALKDPAAGEDAALVTAARSRLLAALEKAGLGPENLESRYYSELLA